MIPLRDDAPRINTPYITYFLLAANIIVFLFEVMLAPPVRNAFVYEFGLVPANITNLLGGVPQITPEAALLPIVTSMFLHGSWLHLIANMWALYIFGDNVEDHLGHFLYLVLYLGTGVAASLVHTAFNVNSTVPSVGASGAIAGIMGAYFVLYPAARVLTLVPFFFIFFVWLPAWVVLGYWFVAQFLSGAATAITATSRTTGGIAFWAHVGGFVAGVVLIRLLPSRPRRYRYGT
ncbi:MAG TPA: rhomboid family intramembrane serine protease [Clostridia bacterium]|nr:rhomboid family intramembrane serine protease [Clostridia bacterium]